MNTKEAKDFLVQQVAEQASLEKIDLSAVEKQMMYFTESDPDSCPDPLALNDEFEAKYEMRPYELKIGSLLDHAYRRLKKENLEKIRMWDEAISTLKKGDHYILVLGRLSLPSEHPVRDRLIMVAVGLLLVAGILIVTFLKSK